MFLDPGKKFFQAKEVNIKVKSDSEGKIENFIDVIIYVRLDEEVKWFKLSSCVNLSIYTMYHPVNKKAHFNTRLLRIQHDHGRGKIGRTEYHYGLVIRH